MKKIFNLFNNEKEIGKVNANITNLKRIMILSAIGFTVLTTTGCSKESGEKVVIEDTYVELTKDEPRYKIEYKVQYGDTLTGIVYSYESDSNKVYDYIDDIVRENDLDNEHDLRQGTTITLVGVPESKLEDYGYSSDYSLFDPEYELRDRAKFINTYNDYIYKTDENASKVEMLITILDDLETLLERYYDEEDPDVKASLLDSLLIGYREACEDIHDLVGVDFDDHHTAYPLSEALEQNVEKSL